MLLTSYCVTDYRRGAEDTRGVSRHATNVRFSGENKDTNTMLIKWKNQHCIQIAGTERPLEREVNAEKERHCMWRKEEGGKSSVLAFNLITHSS